MSKIDIKKIGITNLSTDAVVNAANEWLRQGSGVCGYIFAGAGADMMTKACNEYGHCNPGSAVITPGFNLPARYVIHAVGPIWHGGYNEEESTLYSAYTSSLKLCIDNNLHSIGFPLISAGIYGYPLKPAWEVAIRACRDFIRIHEDYHIDITFAVIDDRIMKIGQDVLMSD